MRQVSEYKNKIIYRTSLALFALVALLLLLPASAYAGKICGDPNSDQFTEVSFDFGCTGQGNAITDATFAIIRFLTLGVGLVIVASLTYAGIQYTASRGDPKATAEAIGRIRSNVVAFVIFLLSFAILNYLIPEGFIGL